MLDALARVWARHDLGMMLIAVAVGLAAALCLFRLRSRMRHSRGMVRLAWVFLSAMVAGVGCWSAEIAALGSMRFGLVAGFEPLGVLAALLISVLGAAGALSLAWTSGDRLRVATGAIVLAFCAAGMHFVATGALRMAADTSWSPVLVWTAVVATAGGYCAALLLAGEARGFGRQVAGATILSAATLVLHLVSLAGYGVRPDPAVAPPAGLMAPDVATFIALTLSVLTTLGGLGAAYIDDVSSRSASQRMRRLADAAREAIVVLSEEGRVLDCNAAFAALSGLTTQAAAGVALCEVLALEGEGALAHDRTCEGTLRGADGDAIPVEAHARPLGAAREDGLATTIVTLRDLRDQRAVEDRIRFLAEHDPLTGLPNREMMNRAVREGLGRGVVFTLVRVVNHAEINSLYGHATGDAVLVKTAERLRRFGAAPLAGYACMAARLGGAEFAFIAFGAPEMAQEGSFGASLMQALTRPVPAEAHAITPQIAAGVSAAPLDARSLEELVRHAEVALESSVRGESSEGIVFFRQHLQDDLIAQRNLVHDLRAGLERDEFVVHYQPQARAADGRLCGFEALVRWIHPERGFMPPDSFIPAAEQSGLIVELGQKVLRLACREAAGWSHPVPVAVNLSPLQVGQADLPRIVHEVLMETGLPPARLELEITESALFRDYQRALDTLRRLKALGVKIAMDDFGTGFSSLSTLQSFPFDKLKIDKSFVNGVGTLARSTVIVKAVLGIGKGLDIPVVAEGVETAEQMAFLRDEGCAAIQGYHIGKPGRIELHADLFAALDRPEPAAPTVTPLRAPTRRRARAAG